MAERRTYSEIVIVGSGIEIYWLALVCSKRIPNGALIRICDLACYQQPIFSVGPWLDELHELISVSHDDFMRLHKPRLCLGLEVQLKGKSLFLPSAPTGMSYRGVPFARLYGALGGEQLGLYAEYNYANQLHQAKSTQPPRNVASAMCEGLQMDYVIKGDEYRHFLIECLRASGVNVALMSFEGLAADCSREIVDSVINRAEHSNEVLFFDLTGGGGGKISEYELESCANAEFFALNQLIYTGNNWLRSISYDREWRLDIDYSWRRPLIDMPCVLPASLHHIKLGGGVHNCLGDLSQRIFFYQLRDLHTYWPEPDVYECLAKKFNRTWQGWFADANDYYQSLYSVCVQQEPLSAANLARVELFKETGCLPQRDDQLVQPWEWENIFSFCLNVVPAGCCLPQSIDPSAVLWHAQQIKRSFVIR